MTALNLASTTAATRGDQTGDLLAGGSGREAARKHAPASSCRCWAPRSARSAYRRHDQFGGRINRPDRCALQSGGSKSTPVSARALNFILTPAWLPFCAQKILRLTPK